MSPSNIEQIVPTQHLLSRNDNPIVHHMFPCQSQKAQKGLLEFFSFERLASNCFFEWQNGDLKDDVKVLKSFSKGWFICEKAIFTLFLGDFRPLRECLVGVVPQSKRTTLEVNRKRKQTDSILCVNPSRKWFLFIVHKKVQRRSSWCSSRK